MPDSDALTAAREKVLDWGPDLRQPAQMERFRQDVAELERIIRGFGPDPVAPAWDIDTSALGSGPVYVVPEDDADNYVVIARDSDGRVWSPEEVGAALGAVAKAAAKPWDRPARPLPVPGHSGPLQSNGPDDPWTCNVCRWTEGDPPREHGEEPAT
jgi:hypothetical protein